MSHYLPDFYTPLPTLELLPLSGCSLQMALFDSDRFHSADYNHCGVDPIAGQAKRQAEHLAGRLCARRALKHLGIDATPSRGKQGQPIWPTGFVGSISHSHGYAAAMAGFDSHWQSLGLDIERPIGAERSRRLAKTVLTPAELQSSSELCDEAFAKHLSQVFSLKESLFKALFPLVNQRFYFQHAEVIQLETENALLRLNLDLSPTWTCGTLVTGYCTQYADLLISTVAIASQNKHSKA